MARLTVRGKLVYGGYYSNVAWHTQLSLGLCATIKIPSQSAPETVNAVVFTLQVAIVAIYVFQWLASPGCHDR